MARVAAGNTLSASDSELAFTVIMRGEATPAQIGGLLAMLHQRGETADEFLGALRAVRAHLVPIEAPPEAIDVCGTGGDGQGTLNISTAVAFVVAACDVPVAKHGNRALSSRAGGADVLAALGIAIPPQRAEAALAQLGLTFLFAPNHHPALKHAAGPRAELGFRTLFNLLGPAANPARVRRQLVGVFAPNWAAPMAATLGALGAEHVWAVCSQGCDELTLAGENTVAEYRAGTLREFTVAPADAGLAQAPLEAIAGGDAAVNAAALVALLEGAQGPYHDTVILNAAASLIVAGRATTLREGVEVGARAIASGAALAKLKSLQTFH